jgi:hypothetical protein
MAQVDEVAAVRSAGCGEFRIGVGRDRQVADQRGDIAGLGQTVRESRVDVGDLEPDQAGAALVDQELALLERLPGRRRQPVPVLRLRTARGQGEAPLLAPVLEHDPPVLVDGPHPGMGDRHPGRRRGRLMPLPLGAFPGKVSVFEHEHTVRPGVSRKRVDDPGGARVGMGGNLQGGGEHERALRLQAAAGPGIEGSEVAGEHLRVARPAAAERLEIERGAPRPGARPR